MKTNNAFSNHAGRFATAWATKLVPLLLLLTLPSLASAQVAASLLAQRARYYESIGPGGQEYDSPNFPTLGGLADHQFIAYSLDDTNRVNPHDGVVLLADAMGFGRLTSAPTLDSAMFLSYDGPKPKQEAGGFLTPNGVLAWIQYLAVVMRQGQPPVPQLVVPVLVRAMGSVNVFGAYDALAAGWLCVTSSVRVAVSGVAQTLGFADGLNSFGYDQLVRLNVTMLPDGPNGPFYYVGYLAFDVRTAIQVTNVPEEGPLHWDAEAVADPIVQIDPTYPYASYFSLVVSSNASPTSGWSPLLQPRLTTTGVVGTNLSLSFESASNATYAVDYKDDLRSTNWLFHSRLPGNGTQVSLQVAMTNRTQRFFRLRQP
jgi:hypothetical protein